MNRRNDRTMKQTDYSNRKQLFVIGYPKSGNTWLARLCADALDAPMVGGENPIDKADEKQIYKGKFLIFKKHCSEKSKPEYITESSKVFYIVRDFRDILVSGFFFNHRNYDHNKLVLSNANKIDINRIYRLYFNHQIRRTIKRWTSHELVVFLNFINRRKSTFDSWGEHVNYWIEFPNVCVVKYEDLLADTFTTLKKSFSKIKISCSDGRLLEAIEHQSFKNRKKAFEEKGDQVNAKFMRKGVTGDWKRFLDEKMIQRIKKAHGLTMNRLGYEI